MASGTGYCLTGDEMVSDHIIINSIYKDFYSPFLALTSGTTFEVVGKSVKD